MKAPKHKVTKLKIARNGTSYTATWETPKNATAEKVKKGNKSVDNEYRFSNVDCSWTIRKNTAPVAITRLNRKGRNATSDSMNMNSFAPQVPPGTYTRDSFYPKTSAKVTYVEAWVRGYNSEGSGPGVSQTYFFYKPKDPKVEWAYNQNAASVTVTVTSDAGADNYERYDTMASVKVKLGNGKEQQIKANASVGAGTTWTATYQVASYEADFSAGQTLVFSCSAYSRGLAGDSATKSSTITVGAPNAATIQSVAADTMALNGRIRVGVSVGARTSSVQLERRHGESGSWETVNGAVDDGSCKALYDTIGMAELVNGERLYYRVVSTYLNYTAVSAPFWAESLYTEAISAGSVSIGFVGDLIPADNGESAKAVIGWNSTGQDIAGIEVSWSEDPNAWNSTDPPNTFDATWSDAESQSTDWDNTLTIYILGLKQGSTYYVTARPYVDNEGERTFADYAGFKTVSPTTRPSSVVLDAPDYIARGEEIPLTWTFDGDSEQTEWHVFSEGSPLSTKLEGFDSMGYASVPESWYGDSDSIELYVQVGAGGALTQSNAKVVGITDYPECWVMMDGIVASKPAPFTVVSTSSDCRVIVRCVSKGVGDHGPLGGDAQYEGDSAWAANLNPEWISVDAVILDPQATVEELAWAEELLEEYGNGIYAAEVSIEMDAALVDGAGYSLSAYVVDNTTGLSSGEALADFAVEWSHQAPSPSDDTYVEADPLTRSATVYMYTPDGAAETDLCDVYRQTMSGFELIATDLKVNDTFTDRYAAFSDGSLGYRIAIRTVDGDAAWADYLYELPVEFTRFDWPGGVLELGWALQFDDNYEKSFQAREHKDGSIGGAYNPAVFKKGTYTAKLIKEIDADAVLSMLALAEYPGPVYCRRPDGNSFQCNVNLSASNRQRSMLIDPSFSVERVSLTEDFMLAPDDVEGWDEAEEE